jgi:hypothetical protein
MSETTRTHATYVALELMSLQSKQPTQESFIALAAAIDDFIVSGRSELKLEGKPSFTVV